MSEQAAAPVVDSIESALNDIQDPSSQQESAPAPSAAKPAENPEAIQEKKEAGIPLTKKEETQLREYKLKVNGKDKAVKVNLSDEKEMQKYLQKAFAADEAFKQAADFRNAAQSFFQELKANPKKVLSDPNIGIDVKKFAESIINEQIAEMEKSPEQKEREKLQRELQDLKDSRDKEKKDFESKELARIQTEHQRNLESEISTALDVGGLPKTPRTVKHMAEMMMIAMQHGIELTAQEIAPIVKTSNASELKTMLDSMSDDQVEDFIGKEILGRLRKKNVAKAKAVETANAVKQTAQAKKEEKPSEPNKKISIRDWLKV